MIKNPADLDVFKKMYGIDDEIEKPQKLQQKPEYLEMLNHWEMVYGKGRKMTENSYKTSCGCIHYFVNIMDNKNLL